MVVTASIFIYIALAIFSFPFSILMFLLGPFTAYGWMAAVIIGWILVKERQAKHDRRW